MHLTALEEAEIIPGKHSDTRIKPLTLTNDHGRHITVTRTDTCVCWRISVKYIAVNFLAVSLLKPPPGSRSGLKNPLELLQSSIYIWLGWAYISKKVHRPLHQGVCFDLPMIFCA
jgi:hypothetical protein